MRSTDQPQDAAPMNSHTTGTEDYGSASRPQMVLWRWSLSWACFLTADLIWRVFDRWTRIGMGWRTCRCYSALMTWSDAIQAGGRGPWGPPNTPGVVLANTLSDHKTSTIQSTQESRA